MIDFQTVNVAMPPIDAEAVRKWIVEVAGRHAKRVGRIDYCFCDDPYIRKANVEFLGHDYDTDVITFDYTRGDRISGDILSSLDTVADNALNLGVTYDSELHRVIIHGILHLCGINDKGPGEREIMEAHENDALSIR